MLTVDAMHFPNRQKWFSSVTLSIFHYCDVRFSYWPCLNECSCNGDITRSNQEHFKFSNTNLFHLLKSIINHETLVPVEFSCNQTGLCLHSVFLTRMYPWGLSNHKPSVVMYFEKQCSIALLEVRTTPLMSLLGHHQTEGINRLITLTMFFFFLKALDYEKSPWRITHLLVSNWSSSFYISACIFIICV